MHRVLPRLERMLVLVIYLVYPIHVFFFYVHVACQKIFRPNQKRINNCAYVL